LSRKNTVFEIIAKNLSDGIVIVDQKGKVRFVNPAALALFAQKKEDLLGQDFEFPLHLGDTSANEVFPLLLGDSVMAEMKVAGIRWEGQPAYLASIRDISDRKLAERLQEEILERRHMEKKLRQANEKLKKLDQQKSDVVSVVSHELRSPMAFIREGVSHVSEEIAGPLTADQRQILSVTLGRLDCMGRLIQELLDISKIEAGSLELQREKRDAVALVKFVVSEFRPQAQKKSLVIRERYSQPAIESYIDQDRITQVFTNLLGNALRFTERGFIDVSVTQSEGKVECSVADTGGGIKHEDLPKVFQKFQQFGRARGGTEKGTGLGLSIVKAIVELHGGEITVESKLNKGTKFTFTLPHCSPKDFFKQYLTSGLRKAAMKESVISIAVFGIKDYELVLEKAGENKFGGLIDRMAKLIQSNLRRREDVAVKDTRMVLAMLPGTKKQDAISVSKRIGRALKEFITGKKLSYDVRIWSKVASFPEDGQTEEVLLDRVLQ